MSSQSIGERAIPNSNDLTRPKKKNKLKALLSKAKSSLVSKTRKQKEAPGKRVDKATQTPAEPFEEVGYALTLLEQLLVPQLDIPSDAATEGLRGPIIVTRGTNSESLEAFNDSGTVSQESALKLLDSEMAARARLSRLIVEDEKRYFAIDDARRYYKEIQKICQNTKQDVPPYTFLELIGKGSFGRVYKVKDNHNNKLVALKIIDCDIVDFKHSRLRDVTVPEIIKEIQILQGLKNQGAKNTQQILSAFAFHSQVWILSEYCPGGSISTLLRAQSPLKEKYIKIIARELAIGMKSFHELGFVHRDIKGANVMIHERGELQIIDFGVAAELVSNRDKRSTLIGTPHFMPPELLNNNPFRRLRYGTEVDVWAYGCTLYEMATGFAPGVKSRKMPDFIDLLQNPPRLEDENYSVELRDLIAFILKPKVQDRPTMSDICEHAYIAKSAKEYPTSILSEMIQQYQQWESRGGVRTSLLNPLVGPAMFQASDFQNDSEEWNFSLTTQGVDELEMEVTEEDIDEALSQNRNILGVGPSANFHSAQQDSLEDAEGFCSPYISEGTPELDFQHNPDYQSDFTPSPSSQYSPTTPRAVREGDLYTSETPPTHRPAPPSNKGKSKATNYKMSDKTPSEAAALDLDRSLRTGESAVRGPTWALMGAYDPPTSDLPLRTGDHTLTHHQELQIGTGIGSSSSVPPVDLSSVAQAKANAQSKRQTMEWKFPVKRTPTVTSDVPALPTPHTRPQLHHAATAPVRQRDDDDNDSGTLDLDALMGDDLKDVRASELYAMPNSAAAMDFGNPRNSGTLDLDAMMAGDNEAGATSSIDEGPVRVGFGERFEGEVLAGPSTAAQTTTGPSIGVVRENAREAGNGREQQQAGVHTNGVIAPHPSTLATTPAPRSLHFEEIRAPPTVRSFPMEIYDADRSTTELAAHVGDAFTDLAETLAACWNMVQSLEEENGNELVEDSEEGEDDEDEGDDS